MAKYKLQEMSDVHHTGKRKVYPKMVGNRTLSRKEFIERQLATGCVTMRNKSSPLMKSNIATHSKRLAMLQRGHMIGK